jgi:hypothetical protein
LVLSRRFERNGKTVEVYVSKPPELVASQE